MRAFFLIFFIVASVVPGLFAQETEAVIESQTTIAKEPADPTAADVTTETTTVTETTTTEAALPEQPATDAVEYEEPLPLIPDNMEDPVAFEDDSLPAETPAPAQPSEATVATIQELQELKDRIRFREVRSRASGDPAVVAEWEASKAAKTDPEKRDALRRYYKALYSRMGKLDSSLDKKIAVAEKLSLRVLDQPRVHPEDRKQDEELDYNDPAKIKIEEKKKDNNRVL